MSKTKRDYARMCDRLLKAETEAEVAAILTECGVMDPRHWKLLGDMPNNRSMVNNQQQDPTGALVEKVINCIDAILTKECFLRKIAPDSPQAPQTMVAAVEKFFRIRDGNLVNLLGDDRTRLAENIQVVATGERADPSFLVIDRGEGQTPARFEDTFLSLRRANKARIPFVQGKFNCGGTGVLPFCGSQAYEFIVSRRCPDLPSGPKLSTGKDATHDWWGFTLVRRLPASAGIYDTAAYVYLAPDGEIPRFQAGELLALPESGKQANNDDEGEAEEVDESDAKSRVNPPKPYRVPLKHGTVIKLYNYRSRARSLATRDVRYELERYLYQLALPIRVTETRQGYRANYFATTVTGTSVTVAEDRSKGYLEDNFPAGGEIAPEGIGRVPIGIALYREKTKEGAKAGVKAKATKRLPKGLQFTINGQVHYAVGPEFFVTRGLNYDFIKDTLLVTADCTHLPDDIRDQLIMPSRDRLRKVPEFERILESIVADLKDRDVLRAINDARKLRRVKEALTEESTQSIFQSLINKDPVFASLFKGGKGLRNPFGPGPEPPEPPYKGKLPPTYFHFTNGKNQISKSFAVDRTCAVELETDAVNGYFELADPNDRGELRIEPACYERWNLTNGHLRIVFRAPSNAKIGDTLAATITVTDPNRAAAGSAPWVNQVTLTFTEGGKEVKPGQKKAARQGEGEALGLPKVVPVYQDHWGDHDFNDHSALRITSDSNGAYVFFVNMDNTYLHNELLRRKEHEKEQAKFAFQWGLVLIALGMLHELKGRQSESSAESGDEEERKPATLEEEVGRFSAGVAAVIVPTVLNLLDGMEAVQDAAVSP